MACHTPRRSCSHARGPEVRLCWRPRRQRREISSTRPRECAARRVSCGSGRSVNSLAESADAPRGQRAARGTGTRYRRTGRCASVSAPSPPDSRRRCLGVTSGRSQRQAPVVQACGGNRLCPACRGSASTGGSGVRDAPVLQQQREMLHARRHGGWGGEQTLIPTRTSGLPINETRRTVGHPLMARLWARYAVAFRDVTRSSSSTSS